MLIYFADKFQEISRKRDKRLEKPTAIISMFHPGMYSHNNNQAFNLGYAFYMDFLCSLRTENIDQNIICDNLFKLRFYKLYSLQKLRAN